MADTNPTATGPSTSEGKLTLVAVILGTILEGLGAVLHQVQDAGHGAVWFPAVLAIIGVLLQLATVLGYQKSRTVLKATMVAADAAPAVVPK